MKSNEECALMKEKSETPHIKETPIGPVTPGHYLIASGSIRRLRPPSQEDARFSQIKGIWVPQKEKDL